MDHGTTIHLVDNDQDLLDALSLSLLKDGFAVRTYTSAEAFLNIVRNDGLNYAVSESQIPSSELDHRLGLEERHVLLPLRISTASGHLALAVQELTLGPIYLPAQPFVYASLFLSIRNAIESWNTALREKAGRRTVQEKQEILSKREREVLSRVVNGVPNREIALELGISTRTVESHRARLMKKMEVRSLAELVKMVL